MNMQEIIKRLNALSADEDRCKYCNSSTISGGDIYCSAGHSHDMNCGGKEFKLDYKIKEVISALEQQLTNGWIPVSSGRLPEDTDGDDLATVYVCMKFKDSPFGNDDAVYQDVVDFMTDKKIWLIEDDFEVTAWRPRFEPYKEVSE